MSDKTQDLGDLQKKIVKFRDDRDWKKFHNVKDMALSLSLEASELLEVFQWKNEEDVKSLLKDNPDKISDELADVLYWILLISHDLNIDIIKELSRKIQVNIDKYPISKAKGVSTKYTEFDK